MGLSLDRRLRDLKKTGKILEKLKHRRCFRDVPDVKSTAFLISPTLNTMVPLSYLLIKEYKLAKCGEETPKSRGKVRPIDHSED